MGIATEPLTHARCEILGTGPDPVDFLAAWPDDLPLAALMSGGPMRTSSARARWSMLACPFLTLRIDHEASGPEPRFLGEATDLPTLVGDPLADFDSALRWSERQVGHARALTSIPAGAFAGGWIGLWSYELGRTLEPAGGTVCARAAGSRWPLGLWHWCPEAFVHDRENGCWYRVGYVGTRSRLPEWSRLLSRCPGARGSDDFELGPLRSAVTAEEFQHGVARAVEYIHAGDVFQVNLAHPLRSRFDGSARALFAEMVRRAEPGFGAYIEDPGRTGGDDRGAVASISPELFLDLDRTCGTVVTRPIKGTRRLCSVDDERRLAAELLCSEKDAAELAMIVDLMRNDLGRVCRFGSVRVADARTLERHGGSDDGSLLHTVASIEGRLCPGLGVGDLLRATFPGGSITGAPKVRAMQIIDELERRIGTETTPDGAGAFMRGPYTGAIGYVSRERMTLSISIRTALVRGAGVRERPGRFADAELEYAVGAGIVADSVPEREWLETLDKAGVIRLIAAEHLAGSSSSPFGDRLSVDQQPLHQAMSGRMRGGQAGVRS